MKKLIPYAGAERPKAIALPAHGRLSGAELLEQMIIGELGLLNKKMNEERAKLAALERRLTEVRNVA